MFAFITQHVVIKVPERTSDCLEPKTLKKCKYFEKTGRNDKNSCQRVLMKRDLLTRSPKVSDNNVYRFDCSSNSGKDKIRQESHPF